MEPNIIFGGQKLLSKNKNKKTEKGLFAGIGIRLGFRHKPGNPGFEIGFGSKISDSEFSVGSWVLSWVLESFQTQTIYNGEQFLYPGNS